MTLSGMSEGKEMRGEERAWVEFQRLEREGNRGRGGVAATRGAK